MRPMIPAQKATAVAQWNVPSCGMYAASPSGVFQSYTPPMLCTMTSRQRMPSYSR